MELKYIIEICVAIDIAILGIAYPIIVDKISNIGEKYSSNYLSELFNKEFPQRAISKKYPNFSVLKFILYSTLLSFIFLIFPLRPLFHTDIGWIDWLISNSAKLIVLSLTIVLSTSFLIWLDKVFTFNGKSTTILKRVINNYKGFESETILKTYHLKTINELAIYAIKNSDKHLQKTLLEFYYSEISNLRKNHDLSNEFEYPNEFYEFVYNLISELIIQDNVKLSAIEHRAVSANWFLSPDFRAIPISNITYNWLWRNLCLIHKKPKYVQMFWSTSVQHMSYQLRVIHKEYDYEHNRFLDNPQIEKRDKERARFFEFHYALGGLLLYSKQYSSINYILTFTQSIPPNYPLLPDTTTEIFNWFEDFRNEFKENDPPIDERFYFPELDNLGNSHLVRFWICSYLTLLFVRQFTMHKYYTFQNFIASPHLPTSIIELNNWYEGISFFKNCLNKIISNTELIDQLGYQKILDEKKTDILSFPDQLKETIKGKIGEEKLNAPISKEKIKQFNLKTKQLISESFQSYNIIKNRDEYDNKTEYIKTKLNGINSLFSKSSFTDNDISSLNYDSFLAGTIARETIGFRIPNSFFTSRTVRYLLKEEDLIAGIKKLKINKDEFVIVGINLYQHMDGILKEYEDIICKIRSSKRSNSNTLFILKKTDLPFITHEDLTEEEIENYSLKLLDKELKLYTSVDEIENQEGQINWDNITNPNDIEINVKVSIAFISYVAWKKDRKVIQISINSPYEEQGVPNSIDEIEQY